MRIQVIKRYSECFKRQAGPASQDSCSKIQMLNGKCSVLNALHPRYPRRSFTPCAPGNNNVTTLDQDLTAGIWCHGRGIEPGRFGAYHRPEQSLASDLSPVFSTQAPRRDAFRCRLA